MEKNVENSIKNGVIITIEATGILFGQKVVYGKPPVAYLSAMDIVQLFGLICGEVFVRDYAVYKKWIKE